MHARDSLSFINRLEERYPVDRWTVNGLPVWPLMRSELFFTLRNKALGPFSPAPQGHPIVATLRRAGRLAREVGS